MKILVIDDNGTHCAAARAQLKDHQTMVVDSYDLGQKLVDNKHDFEVVFVDLLMPASRQSMGGNLKFIGQELPVGIFLALLAAKNGAKHVVVFTDSDHHSHPASACFDAFNRGATQPEPFAIESAQVWLVNNPNWVRNHYKEDLSQAIGYREYSAMDQEKREQITVSAKNWRALFNHTILGIKEED